MFRGYILIINTFDFLAYNCLHRKKMTSQDITKSSLISKIKNRETHFIMRILMCGFTKNCVLGEQFDKIQGTIFVTEKGIVQAYFNMKCFFGGFMLKKWNSKYEGQMPRVHNTKKLQSHFYKKFILRGKIFEIRKEVSLQRKCCTSTCSTVSLQRFVSTSVLEM